MNDVSAARWLGTILAAATIAVYAQVWSDAITAARAGGRTDLLPGLEAAVAACRARSPVGGAP